MKIITPTVGRQVWFWDVGRNHECDQPEAATIVYVLNERLVNLQVISMNGFARPEMRVVLRQEGDDPTTGFYCEWMPYQKGQAAKTEQLEAAAANDDPISSAYETLKAAIRNDPGYAWSWHCNLAMPIFDAGVGVDHRGANEAAADLMRHLFNVDSRASREWIATFPTPPTTVEPLKGPGADWLDTRVVENKTQAIDPIEREIQAKGLNAPRITPADIEANIASEHYFTAGDGVYGETLRMSRMFTNATPDALGLLTFCVLVLRNGFTVHGHSACASPENFDAELGQKIARKMAVEKVWPLMGYELRSKLRAQAWADLAPPTGAGSGAYDNDAPEVDDSI